MNDFYKQKPTRSYILDKNSSKYTAQLLNISIDNDFPPQEADNRFNVVYIYSLKDKTFNYPLNKSNVIYIGHTHGEKNNNKKSLGFRFKHCLQGRDNKQNICLEKYYDRGFILNLDIFILDDSQPCLELETKLRYNFLTTYGSLPIADGAAFSSEKIKQISQIIDGDDE